MRTNSSQRYDKRWGANIAQRACARQKYISSWTRNIESEPRVMIQGCSILFPDYFNHDLRRSAGQGSTNTDIAGPLSRSGGKREMRGYVALGLIGLPLAACAAKAVNELPAGFYGTYQDNDVGAINQSSWAWASPGRTAGNPLEAIKAVIAIDWLTDELEVNPRWVEI